MIALALDKNIPCEKICKLISELVASAQKENIDNKELVLQIRISQSSIYQNERVCLTSTDKIGLYGDSQRDYGTE